MLSVLCQTTTVAQDSCIPAQAHIVVLNNLDQLILVVSTFPHFYPGADPRTYCSSSCLNSDNSPTAGALGTSPDPLLYPES
jgi:hypothetical protein